MNTNMKDIFKKNGSDKGVTGKYPHHYHTVYESVFESRRNEPIKILEVGIWKGTSHQSWLDYFPNAEVYGIDIFTRVQPEDVPALQDDRCHYIKADSTDPRIQGHIEAAWGKDITFDFIIDDGLHTPSANKKTFENLWEYTAKGGSFLIEDVWPINKMTFDEARNPWLQKAVYSPVFYDMFLEALPEGYVEYDCRYTSGVPDSYIIEIKND